MPELNNLINFALCTNFNDQIGLNNSGDILLEKIVEEDTPYLNDHSTAISPIEIENDTKQLLRRESITDAINITRI